MTRRDKRIEAMSRNPKNVRPDDLDVVLIAAGFSMRQQGTSHRVYVRGAQQLTVPQRHPFLLPVYVKQALAFIDMEEET
jgi:hypothetical protein